MSETPCKFAQEARTNGGDPFYFCNVSNSYWGTTKCTGLSPDKKTCPFWVGAGL